MAQSRRQTRLIEFLDRLAGAGRGKALLGRLSDSGESIDAMTSEIGKSSAFEDVYKRARAFEVDAPALTRSDFAYVGLPDIKPSIPSELPTFERLFDDAFRPRLAKRADGFALLFERLSQCSHKPMIVETGTLRIPGNWEGDGQSTFMFDLFVQQRHGTFFSIDLSPRSIESARRACSSATMLIANDSVYALNKLSETLRGARADLLYLDSFDFDAADPLPSATHHALELAAARPLIGAGSMICVDDYAVGDPPGGKGRMVEMFLDAVHAIELYSGYQKIWLVP